MVYLTVRLTVLCTGGGFVPLAKKILFTDGTNQWPVSSHWARASIEPSSSVRAIELMI